jgi:hypothetical protein
MFKHKKINKMNKDLTAQEVRQLLKLEPHATCGFVRVTFVSKQQIAPGGLPPPFIDGRPAPRSISWSHQMRRYAFTGSATISFITVI